MKQNKHIERNTNSGVKIFDNRSLETDYRTLVSILKPGMSVLDVGCGTGAISKDIAHQVGDSGKVLGIDNTEKFISSGSLSYGNVKNLELRHCDLFALDSEEKFDLIVAARMLQWLSNPKDALLKMKSMLKPNGQISILDYNHENLEWKPEPPDSMKTFYSIFLKWRRDAGMNNTMADDIAELMDAIGMDTIEVINSDEHYERNNPDFISKVGIWSKVAGSSQMVTEGCLEDDLRLRTIQEYEDWVQKEAISMTMKLNEVRAKLP